jgi:hypothetical protein
LGAASQLAGNHRLQGMRVLPDPDQNLPLFHSSPAFVLVDGISSSKRSTANGLMLMGNGSRGFGAFNAMTVRS